MNRHVRLLAVALALAACQAQPTGPAPLEGARIGGPFKLIDQNGRPFTDADLRGRYAVVYFGYTFCPDVCPIGMGAIAAGLKQVEASDPALGAKVVPVFVTLDPARDTPAVLKTFVTAFHPRAIGLTGDAAAIAKVARAYAVAHSKGEVSSGGGYLVNHTDAAYLMGPDGKPIATAEQDRGPDAVAAVIRQWVK
ncbi:SCO family protein [Sphingomonas sp.]|jgi:protein SCO1/2|uniref:SCO family protein n=1 Tax=Sphingomonas sp. TaxID=28214 RepID=UPI002D810910|nr:SCO family protein [Sphingomonas sp.]HEU0045497.1 SCO family protein [Sphingomonas sp.]